MAEAAENPEIEEEEEECPKCPPVGAPAWMATFADMATLLMFFVLIRHLQNLTHQNLNRFPARWRMKLCAENCTYCGTA